jgi:hypothetical protein
MHPDQLEEIRKRARAASPGPWFWRGNYDNQDINLSYYTPGKGQMLVMDVVRWGTQGATLRFGVGQIMKKAQEFIEYIVCSDATDRRDRCVYRGHIADIRHPDAQFIAHARQDVDDLLAHVKELEAKYERCDRGYTELLWKDG